MDESPVALVYRQVIQPGGQLHIGGLGILYYTAAYNALTNQVSSGVSPLPTYDANGNALKSTALSSLTWNAAGQPVTVTALTGGAITGTYDALGRLVETQQGSTYTKFIFSPAGGKLAVVQGGVLSKATIPLPGGETAEYNNSGLNFIRRVAMVPRFLGPGMMCDEEHRTMTPSAACASYVDGLDSLFVADCERVTVVLKRIPIVKSALKNWLICACAAFLCAGAAAQHAAPASPKTVAERLGYAADARLLVIEAEDLGMAHSVDKASFEALEKGWVTTAGILVPGPWFPEVVRWSRSHPNAEPSTALKIVYPRIHSGRLEAMAARTAADSSSRVE